VILFVSVLTWANEFRVFVRRGRRGEVEVGWIWQLILVYQLLVLLWEPIWELK
jgi:hypothetical protein